jgi:hypothetical protein
MDIQVLIPPALCAIHNFIRRYDPDEIHHFNDDDIYAFGGYGEGSLASGPPSPQVREQVNALHFIF